MPEPVHLYMLVAGIVLGVLLGPAVLGNAAPNLYDQLFLGSGDMSEVDIAEQAIKDYENDVTSREERINNVMRQAQAVGEPGDSMMVGVEAQVTAMIDAFAAEAQILVKDRQAAFDHIETRRVAHQQKLTGLGTLLLLLVALVMLIEPILAPQKSELDDHGRAEVPAALARLITARYALLGGWLTLALAKPDWLLSISPVVAILLAALVGLAALVPLGKSATSA